MNENIYSLKMKIKFMICTDKELMKDILMFQIENKLNDEEMNLIFDQIIAEVLVYGN